MWRERERGSMGTTTGGEESERERERGELAIERKNKIKAKEKKREKGRRAYIMLAGMNYDYPMRMRREISLPLAHPMRRPLPNSPCVIRQAIHSVIL